MRPVERVPRAATPPAERHAIGPQRRACLVLHEPARVLLEQLRLLFRDERGDPDRRLEAAIPNRLEDAAHVAAERGACVQPVAHRRLIPIVDLDVFEARNVPGDRVEVVEHLLRRHSGTEAVPRTPPGRRSGA